MNEWVVVAVVAVVVLFVGGKKLPEFARGMGQSLKEFRKASHDNEPDDDASSDTAGTDDTKA